MDILLLFLISMQVISVQPARILVVASTVYVSHHLFLRPIFRELALRGHEVVHLTVFPARKYISNLHEIDLSFSAILLPTAFRDSNTIFQIEQYYETMLKTMDVQLASESVQELINNSSEHFDLVINEIISPPMFAFKQRFNCPMILISSMDIFNPYHELDGNPNHALLYSQFKTIKKEFAFYERLMAFIGTLLDCTINNYSKQDNEIVRKHFGDNYPTVAELTNDMDLVLINTNVLINTVRPLSPAYIPIGGGLHIHESKKLPKELQTYLDNSRHGVIYFNLGTYVGKNSLTQSEFNMFLETFAELDYDVLWRFQSLEPFQNKTKNVRIENWLPQQDVLRHKNVKLFITQGGLHSLEEAVFFEVPTITIPFVADQHANAERMHEQNLGVRMFFSSITSTSLKSTIQGVMADQSIKSSLEKAARILQDAPMKPLDRAIWWIEYVIRHKGAKHLRAATLPTWKFYYLDAITVIVSVLIAFVFMLHKTTNRMKAIISAPNSKNKNE